jgi:RHS repeat-associated protein
MGRILAQTKSGNTQFLLPDAQGSTRLLINNSAITQQTYDYRAFGEMVTTPSPLQTRYLYTGQQYDSASGNYSLRARTYNPTNGRFLTQDTYPYNFQNPVEINRYVYGINNPVRYMDASGMSAGDYGKLGAFALSVGGILSRIPPQTKNWLGDLYWGIGRLLTPEQWDELADMLLGVGKLMLTQTGVQELTETKEKEKKKEEIFDLAFGVQEYLIGFATSFNGNRKALPFLYWPDFMVMRGDEYLRIANRNVFMAEFHFMLNTYFAKFPDGEIRFNLFGMNNTEPTSTTSWELNQIVSNPLYSSKTSYYLFDGFQRIKLSDIEAQTRIIAILN